MVRESMRGTDEQQSDVFSYLSHEKRVPKDHPLRDIRTMVDQVLARLSRRFDGGYASVGRPSIPPEKLLRAQLLQILYTIRRERLLMEEMDCNLLFRWFVGLNAMQMTRCGIRPGSPRIVIGCCKPTWPRSSWRMWWHKRVLKL
jgi:hypothetical protein